MNKKLLVAFSATLVLGLAACGPTKPADPVAPIDGMLALGNFKVGENAAAWDYAADAEGNAINLMEWIQDPTTLPTEFATVIGEKTVEYAYKLSDVRLGHTDAGWNATAMKDGVKVTTNGSMAVKVGVAAYDEVDDVWAVEQWIPDPHTAHAESLTPSTLFIPTWQEAKDENGFSWSDNPVCIGGAGAYTLYGVKYAAGTEGAGYAMGLVLEEAGGDYGELVEVKNFVAEEHTYGLVGNFNNWGETPDFPLVWDEEVGGYFAQVQFPAGIEFKVRADSAWDYNWGFESLTDLTEGHLADQGGNILVKTEGIYLLAIGEFTSDAKATLMVDGPYYGWRQIGAQVDFTLEETADGVKIGTTGDWYSQIQYTQPLPVDGLSFDFYTLDAVKATSFFAFTFDTGSNGFAKDAFVLVPGVDFAPGQTRFFIDDTHNWNAATNKHAYKDTTGTATGMHAANHMVMTYHDDGKAGFNVAFEKVDETWYKVTLTELFENTFWGDSVNYAEAEGAKTVTTYVKAEILHMDENGCAKLSVVNANANHHIWLENLTIAG